jgi:protoporphyrinogen oxidase
METETLILGAGPTGLGAAHRLAELGYTDWEIIERGTQVGGLAATVTDEQGFRWDRGGHVMFSHYPYFDELVETMLRGDYDQHVREAWVWLLDRFVPYPFQNNIHRLPPDAFIDCLMGIIDAQRRTLPRRDFAEYIAAVFGAGINAHFMGPYNAKVWAHPLEMMGTSWLGERVPTVDVRRILEHHLTDRDDVTWGPNDTFKFPLLGTGMLYERIAAALPKSVHFEHTVVSIDVRSRTVTFADSTTANYEELVSTIPLTELVRSIPDAPAEVVAALDGLHHTSGIFVGIGIDEPTESRRCWVYFPEPEIPFYRVTYLSNYSSAMTPRPDQFSLLAEVAVSPHRPDTRDVVDRTIDGMVRAGLLTPEQVATKIVSRHVDRVTYSYPVPTLARDRALAIIQPWLMQHRIHSRGRFGAWRYEIGNTDHAVMMGVELADHLVDGVAETTWGLVPGDDAELAAPEG